MNDKIPVEILGLIFGHLWNSPGTVKASSLTCRTWNTASRPYVYRCITLYSERNLEALITLLQESSGRTRSWIRDLQMFAIPYLELSAPYWVSSVPMPLPQLLCRLEVLRLQGLRHQSPSVPPFLEYLSKFTTVQELVLVKTTISLVALQRLVGALPNITTLRLLDIRVKREPGELAISSFKSRPLTTLFIQSANKRSSRNACLFLWLSTMKITRLGVGGEKCISCHWPYDLLDPIAPSVEHLRILTLHSIHESPKERKF